MPSSCSDRSSRSSLPDLPPQNLPSGSRHLTIGGGCEIGPGDHLPSRRERPWPHPLCTCLGLAPNQPVSDVSRCDQWSCTTVGPGISSLYNFVLFHSSLTMTPAQSRCIVLESAWMKWRDCACVRLLYKNESRLDCVFTVLVCC